MLMKGKRVIMIITEGYTEPELWTPYYRFQEEGAEVIIAGPQKGIVCGEGLHGKDGSIAEITHTVEEAMAEPYDMLFLPGGLWSPVALRAHEATLNCVRESMDKGIMTCAICHAPWILISAGVVRGRKISCPADMAIDITNAGGEYVTDNAVRDGNLFTATAFPQLPDLMRLIMENVDEF